MENDDEIKQNLINLYTELQNPSPENAKEISDSILEIYSSSSCIPVLFGIMMNSKNQNFRYQASFGLKNTLSLCSSQLDQAFCNAIWENFFQIILNENNSQSIDILMPSVIEMFKISHNDWTLVAEFIELLSQKNLEKCFQVVSSLLPFVDPNFVISHFDYYTNMIDSSFQSPDKLTLFKYTFLIFFILANDVKIEQFKLFDDLMSMVTKPFTEILISILEDEKLFYESIVTILDSLEIRINPFSLELLFQPIIESLQNSEFSIQRKYSIILLFQSILSCDYSFEIDTETLKNLIISSIPLSVDIFDQSDDIEYPDSFIFSDFFYYCLNRISNENLKIIIQPLFESFSKTENPAELYNLLIFYDACLRRSDYLFSNEYNNIITVLIDCLQIDHPGIRNEVVYIFCSHKFLIESIEKDQIYKFIEMIIEILSSQDFYYGLTIIKVLIDFIDDSDPIFELTFSMCTQIIKDNSETDTSLTEIGLKILNNLVEHSNKNACSVFENLYSNDFSIITSYLENKEKTGYVPVVIKCLSSLSKSCKDKMVEKIEEIFPVLVILFENSNDLKIKQSVLKCMISFVSNLTEEVEKLIYAFLKNTFLEYFTRESIKVLTELVLQREYSYYLFAPSFNFLSKVLQKYPHFFNDNEMIKYLFNVIDKGINQIFEKEIIASLHLFKKTMIFMNNNNIILPKIISQLISIIIQKMQKEISQNVICSMFDVINKAISIFGNSIIFQNEVQLFHFVFKCVDHNKNQFTDEIEYNHVYNDKALQLLSNIIRNFYDNEDNNFDEFNDLLVNNFIPRIIQILNDPNPLFTAFSLNLLSQIAISTKGLLSPEILNDPIQKSLENIENINDLTIPSIIFIESLVYNYHQALEVLTPKLVEIIDAKLPSLDCSSDGEKYLSEYFITLLTILDLHSDDLIDEGKMNMILSRLPIVFSKSLNNKHIYSFLLRHFKDFQNSQFEILKNIVLVFKSAETIIDSQLPQELILKLLALIIQSDILNSKTNLNALFNNQSDAVQSFLQTISFLSERVEDA